MPYPDIESYVLSPYIKAVSKANEINELIRIEGEAAKIYWKEYGKALPEKWGFTERSGREASDHVNTMLNYGYALL